MALFCCRTMHGRRSSRTCPGTSPARGVWTTKQTRLHEHCRGSGKLGSSAPKRSRKPRGIRRARLEGAYRMYTHRAFANGLSDDWNAVKAAIVEPWSDVLLHADDLPARCSFPPIHLPHSL